MIIGILYHVHVKVEQIYNGNMKNFHKDGMQINKNYMLKNHWGTYYIVEFENLNDIKNFSLVLQNE